MKHSIFLNFLRHPTQVGAICASSRVLSCAITDMAGIGSVPQTVVELGPGTGVFTREVLRRQKACGGRFLALEINEGLCCNLKNIFPELELYQENALRLPELLQEKKIDHADVVLAGLPWAIFPEELQTGILDSVCRALHPGGQFLTFAYVQGVWLPAGRRVRKHLQDRFRNVETSPVIWRNLPPAFIYRCTL